MTTDSTALLDCATRTPCSASSGALRWCSTAAKAAGLGRRRRDLPDLPGGIAVNARHNYPAVVSVRASRLVRRCTSPTSSPHGPRSSSPSACLPSRRRRKGRRSSPTAAPSRSRLRSNWRAAPAGPGSSPEGSFHGRSTERSRSPTRRLPATPSRHSSRGRFRATGRHRCLRAAVDESTGAASCPGTDPGRGRGATARHGIPEAASEITRAAGALLVVDEIQTGIGRTGRWFDHQRAGHRARRDDLAKGRRRRPDRSPETFGPENSGRFPPRPARHDLRRQPGGGGDRLRSSETIGD